MTESVNPNISNQEHNAVPPPGTVIPIMEEIAVVSSKTVETGRVRITKQVTQVEQGVHVVGSHDECEVERITLNRIVETAPSVRYEGETMIIPVLKEVAVVEKKLMLVEEVRVTRKKVQTQETIPVTLRKESLEVIREATPTDGNTPSSSAQKL